MSDPATEEQVIVTKGVGVVQPKSDVKPQGATNEAKKRVSPTPLPTETIIGASIRVQLLEILAFGPLSEDRVEWMCNIVEESLPLLQTTMGLKVKRPASPPSRGAVAGVPTVLGFIPLPEWCEAWGRGEGGRIRHAKTVAKIAFRRAKEKLFAAADAEIATEEAKDLEPALRAKLVALLNQPYTPPVAKRLERLLGAISPLYQALGPAADRVKRGKKVQPGNYGFYSPGVYASANYAPLTPPPVGAVEPGEDPNVALAEQQLASMPEFSMASFQSALNGAPMPNPTVGGLDVDVDEGEEAPPLVSSPPVETFGAKIIREIMAMAPVLMNAQRNTPENMVLAIAAAEREGMPKLAAKLRKIMGVEKHDEQETPKPPEYLSGLLKPFSTTTPKPRAPGCAFMFGGQTPECGAESTRMSKNPNGHVDGYCAEHYKIAVERGEAVDDCVGAPQCAVAGTKFGKDKIGVERGYCDFHYTEALASGEVFEGSLGIGFYRNGRCIDCNCAVESGHGPGCSAVAP